MRTERVKKQSLRKTKVNVKYIMVKDLYCISTRSHFRSVFLPFFRNQEKYQTKIENHAHRTMAHINWIYENNVWKCTKENRANLNTLCLCGTKNKLYWIYHFMNCAHTLLRERKHYIRSQTFQMHQIAKRQMKYVWSTMYFKINARESIQRPIPFTFTRRPIEREHIAQRMK